MEFVKIPAGRYDMGIHKKHLQGSSLNLWVIHADEPFRSATASRPFFIKSTEVSWSEWNKVRDLAEKSGYRDIGAGRNGFRGDDSGTHPVTEVSWLDAAKWCNLLSELERRKPVYHTQSADDQPGEVLRAGKDMNVRADWNADGYRLPTESEWEYAWFMRGRAAGHVDPDGWHLANSEGNTHPVSSRPSSTAKDLHDMLGNVAEWCWDWKGPVVPFSHSIDPSGPKTGIHRMIRGGSWAEDPMCARGGYRGDFSPILPRSTFVGFRPVRTEINKRP
jgi:formylglycine-generating enzyme required for sulfatase activity